MIQSRMNGLPAALLFVLCFSWGPPTRAGNPPEKSAGLGKAVTGNTPAGKASGRRLDMTRKIEKLVNAGAGGAFALKTREGASIRIFFPQGALKKDASLVVAPLAEGSLTGDEFLSKGFSLEERGTGTGPALGFPAILTFTLKGDQGRNVSIVRYGGRQGYEVIPTRVFTGKDKTVLVASLTHFSDYGIRKTAPGESASRQEMQDFDWVIYIKDTQTFAIGDMKIAISVNMKAVNTAGDIEGKYAGNAAVKVANRMVSQGGQFAADSHSRSNPFSFNVTGELVPAPLTGDTRPAVSGGADDMVPVPLIPPEEPDNYWTANGSITMVTSAFTGTVDAGGARATGKAAGSTSVLPFSMIITGTQVSMKIQIPEVGTGYFHGYIRGEGKKSPPDDLDDFKPAPLTH